MDVIPVVEYTHPDALKQFTNADWVPQTMQSKAVIEDGFTTLLQYPFMLRDLRVNYFTSNFTVSSLKQIARNFWVKMSMAVFIRQRVWNSRHYPIMKRFGEITLPPLLHELGELQPGEERQIITLLGQAQDLEEARPLIETFRDPAQVDNEFAKLTGFGMDIWLRFKSIRRIKIWM